ncbi:helix-turn-helix domain-containing protein (plasmid) [Streptomyces sp. DSM 116496]|uniref:helix-turn-helix domain-containing protein n=1 Tax=Streptomyces stoeckheimensis TaxID=3344656 RepID=UPI0038B33E85
MSDALRRVDELVDRALALPSPPIRQQLRLAAGLTQTQVADAVGVKKLAVKNWESGKSEPRQPHRDVYGHLLRRLAEKYPAAAVEEPAGEQ